MLLVDFFLLNYFCCCCRIDPGDGSIPLTTLEKKPVSTVGIECIGLELGAAAALERIWSMRNELSRCV